jgi:short-subunit dehydrogenase involved in D-alanine esterification of teichoic acids
MNNLDNKVIVITGGTSGIGLAAAESVLKNGGTVVITGRDAEKGRKALTELGSERASYRQHDAASRVSWDALVGGRGGPHPRARPPPETPPPPPHHAHPPPPHREATA